LPLDLCDEDFFIKWNPAHVQSEILKNKAKINAFKDRKRKFIYLIAGQHDLQTISFTIPMLFNDSQLKAMTMNPLYNRKRS
jgi:hypothetical protein